MVVIKTLFGPGKPWIACFEAIDDRVRGGLSKSFLELGFGGKHSHFHGVLDISALGGAGFCTQRTYFNNTQPSSTYQTNTSGLNLSSYKGLIITTLKGDGKTYSINLKDNVGDIIDPITNKRSSGLEYKYLFVPEIRSDLEVSELGGDSSLNPPINNIHQIPFDQFMPYYRGKPVPKDHEDFNKRIDTTNIKALSVMIASGFGKQFGNFSFVLESIGVYK